MAPRTKRRRKQKQLAASSKIKSRPFMGQTLSVASEEENSDLDVEDMFADDEILEEGKVHFLTELKPDLLMSKKKLKRPAEEACDVRRKRQKREDQNEGTSSSEEAEFEKVPRPSSWKTKGEQKGVHYLLPLKATHGKLILQEPTLLESKGGNGEDSDTSFMSSSPLLAEPSSRADAEGDDEKRDEEGQEERSAPLTAAEQFIQREEKLLKKKESMSLVVSQLMANPEGNICQLKHLRTLCVERDPDVAVKVRKLAMKYFTDVIKDIAPSYRIRELTEAERTIKVSKDIKRIRHFEETILLDYRLFLTQCDETIKVGLGKDVGKAGKRKKESKKPVVLLENDQELLPSRMEHLAEVALECMCDLLVSLPHFNFRNNILVTLVPLVTSKASDGKVSQICCSTIETLFHNDMVGEASFEAVKLVARMVKAKSYKTKPAVLRTFLHLQLRDVDVPVSATDGHRPRTKEERKKEAKEKITKKQKRRQKAELQLDRDLQEANAVESKEKKSKIQTDILKIVFLTYFRILKNSRHSPLLQPVLEGLAKFAHLINVDFFSDLMSVLHSLAETGGLTNRECMHCVKTAFEILSGQGSALNIDPKQFYTQLYGAILQLDACSADSDVLLAVECLDKLLRNRRQISTQRVLGYVKRLSTVVLQLLPGAALSVLATMRKFIQSYSQCEQLLDIEAMAGSGVYRPDVPDPEMSCSSSTLLWELADLRLHFDPTVATYARHLLHGAPSHGNNTLHPDLARKDPKHLLSKFSLHLDAKRVNPEQVIDFEPMSNVARPPTHPALKLAQKKRREYYYTERGFVCAEVGEMAREAMESAEKSIKQIAKQIAKNQTSHH